MILRSVLRSQRASADSAVKMGELEIELEPALRSNLTLIQRPHVSFRQMRDMLPHWLWAASQAPDMMVAYSSFRCGTQIASSGSFLFP
jgi:hypothetical protein